MFAKMFGVRAWKRPPGGDALCPTKAALLPSIGKKKGHYSGSPSKKRGGVEGGHREKKSCSLDRKLIGEGDDHHLKKKKRITGAIKTM